MKVNMKNYISLNTIFLFVFLIFSPNGNKVSAQGIPTKSMQAVVVLTDSTTSTKGELYIFEKDGENEWKLISDKVHVVLGRNGLGYGKGIHNSSDITSLPEKKEGDGRRPA